MLVSEERHVREHGQRVDRRWRRLCGQHLLVADTHPRLVRERRPEKRIDAIRECDAQPLEVADRLRSPPAPARPPPPRGESLRPRRAMSTVLVDAEVRTRTGTPGRHPRRASRNSTRRARISGGESLSQPYSRSRRNALMVPTRSNWSALADGTSSIDPFQIPSGDCATARASAGGYAYASTLASRAILAAKPSDI